ncbi:MAG: TIGR00282 family metallophosphoesterase [Planctomycetes bacterium]|nr:TIGR00282 family metallophosphoesterase [Planctomycetota bacterium]
MELTLLCVGDIVGTAGRRVLRDGLASLGRERDIDCVIVNAENAAGGSGLTAAIYEKINQYGAHLITMGDHIYRRREIIPLLETSDRIVRPANLPTGAPGKEYAVYETGAHHRVAVISLLGRMYMKGLANCPFVAADRVLAAIPKDVKIVVVDIHAEATSEKVAMGWHLDGRVSVVFGTHTHVPTADERVLPKGTAYITDVGMTGPYDSVLGRRKDRVLKAMISAVPNPFDVASGDPRMCGVIVTVDSGTGRATSIERVCFRGTPEAAGDE